jgi:K(+)-stimulated pyrophosphate-energized sodium pump
VLAGVTVSGVLMGIFQSNSGGAWDNAKKSFEKGVMIDGEHHKKGSDPHKSAVTGDTVGDPFKDTSGPAMNILIKLMSIVSLVIAPYIAVNSANPVSAAPTTTSVTPEVAVAGLNKTLSTGVALSFASGGIEDQLIKFIEFNSQKQGTANWFNFKDLNFITGSSELDANSINEVKNISEILKAYPEVSVKIGGYTDNTGDAASNLDLSSKRAASVKDKLISLGITNTRLESEGYGDQHPVADNSTEEGRAQNRRIAVSVRKN